MHRNGFVCVCSTAVRKNLMAAQLGDSARVDGGLRNTAGSPRPAGYDPYLDQHSLPFLLHLNFGTI